MGYLRFALTGLSGLVVAFMAAAQSRPGVSFDQTMHAVVNRAGQIDSSTTVMHLTIAGNDGRIELASGRMPGDLERFSGGAPSVTIMRDGGREMIFLRPDQKQYVSIKPFEMIEGMQKMMQGMGGSMKLDSSVSRINFDSLGPGPDIDGHATLRYRLNLVIRMTAAMMGESRVVETRSTQDIQTAPDLGDFSDVSFGANALSELSQSMGWAKDFGDKVTATRRKMRGFPLRTVKQSTNSANGQSVTTVETTETRNAKRANIPDSLFAIPSDYKQAATPAPLGTGH